jgi:hypothetical protein
VNRQQIVEAQVEGSGYWALSAGNVVNAIVKDDLGRIQENSQQPPSGAAML